MKKNNSKADLKAKLHVLEILGKDQVPCASAEFFAWRLL